ncbi:RHOMBOID-like protein 9, chloroplastic isoform X1 [Cornus florida]|uniref:RHOMBOID-like protein 9, chloroplastic isoform X1 n=1 Tax=Cornus florida TaxID=4283 RepID=UPI0028999421|nr:RHOMBOID-like protein 9, chloroplastic isoform X1 [Cornus florida]
MAVAPICHKMSYKDQFTLTAKEIKQTARGYTCCYPAIQEGFRCFSAIPTDSGRKWLSYTDILLRANTRKDADVSQGIICNRRSTTSHMMTEVSVLPRVQTAGCHLRFSCGNLSQRGLCTAQLSSEPNSNEKQLKALDSYFGKLQNDASQPSSDSLDKRFEHFDSRGQFKAKKWLGSLDNYLAKEKKEDKFVLLLGLLHISFKFMIHHRRKCFPFKIITTISRYLMMLTNLCPDRKPKNYLSSASDGETSEVASRYAKRDSGRDGRQKLKNYVDNKDAEGSYDETSDLYLISILVSIDIAVFLFEIASPIRNSDLFSLPLMYGAKVNDLIIIGEWWRLLTPMFLHSGILHVALGCWVLLTFGPQVSRVYGSFTFFLIYILGGISGNLTSFLHTPEPTVGGTGPVFAIIGAWLVYQIQNRDVPTKDVSESMFQKAIIATALSFVLSNFGPIDDWTHFGAAFTGVVYGFLTCPTLQVEDSSKTGQEEGITLVRRYADPCKSLIVFSLFVLLLSSLVFIIDPPLNSLADDISI